MPFRPQAGLLVCLDNLYHPACSYTKTFCALVSLNRNNETSSLGNTASNQIRAVKNKLQVVQRKWQEGTHACIDSSLEPLGIASGHCHVSY